MVPEKKKKIKQPLSYEIKPHGSYWDGPWRVPSTAEQGASKGRFFLFTKHNSNNVMHIDNKTSLDKIQNKISATQCDKKLYG